MNSFLKLQLEASFFASANNYSLNFEGHLALVLAFLIIFGSLLKISAALLLRVFECNEGAISGTELDRKFHYFV